jgi:hypothetical protein
MADPVFPLARIRLSGEWREEFEDTRIQFQPDQGSPKTRAAFTTAELAVNFSALISAADREALDSFYERDCARGTLPFSWRSPLERGGRRWRFVAPLSYSWRPGRLPFLVTLSLARLPN